ncbi:MAG: phosphoribosylformylglycinamidine cyclo-ligase [Elusimicrobia bacterium]|nr:phosphoribosylformylglycinamidine cyclo-ligase [Elusimicrobiota bacterium]
MKVGYGASGVHLSSAHALLKDIARQTKQPISHFASVVSFDGFRLAFSADGVGTKVELLRASGLNWISGWDAVAMNANDLLCVGARPMWCLDYYAQGRLNRRVFGQVLHGLNKALDVLGARLVGGETAELPGLFHRPEVYDVACFLTGTIADHGLNPRKIRPGDVLVGWPSAGPHANGFSLIRKILTGSEVRARAKELLAPTRLYEREIRPLLADQKTKGMIRSLAHITGGGFIEKLPRAMNENCRAVLRWGSWPVPSVFGYLQKKSNLNHQEACGVWNMGIGLVAVIGQESWPKLARRLGDQVVPIGEITRREARQESVCFA